MSSQGKWLSADPDLDSMITNERDQRDETHCPLITPSGFNIGTILKINDRRSSSAADAIESCSTLEGGGVRRRRKVPRMVQEAFDSPG